MKNAFLLFLCLQFGLIAWCQNITFTTLTGGNYTAGIGQIDIANNWSVTGPNPISFPVGGNTIQAITYHPNGNLYASNLGIGQLLEVDLEQMTGELILSYPTAFGFWMSAGPDNKLYISPAAGGGLATYDIVNDQFQLVGQIGEDGIPYFFHRSMTFINGELFTIIWDGQDPYSESLVKVNLDNTLHSTRILDIPNNRRVTSMTTFNFDCDSSITYLALPDFSGATVLGYDIYQFNVKLSSLTHVRYLEGITITDFTNPTEHLYFDCNPVLDLDELDESGASGLNFKAQKACVEPSLPIFPFGAAGSAITTNTIVDSMWVGLVAGNSNGAEESVGCIGGGALNCTSTNDGIMVYNVEQLSNSDLLAAFKQSIFYQNNAEEVLEGSRKIAVVAYNHDYPSDTAFLVLPLVVGIVAEGIVEEPSSATSADASIRLTTPIGSDYEYLWSNGYTVQDLTDVASGDYAVTITNGSGCSKVLNFTIDFSSAAGITTNNSFGAVIVPNPSGSNGAILQLDKTENGLVWTITDITGRLIVEGQAASRSLSLPIGLKEGVYLVGLFNGQKRAYLKWVVTGK